MISVEQVEERRLRSRGSLDPSHREVLNAPLQRR